MKLNKSLWQNKRVLVTGHTGFKGAWLVLLLHRMGAKVSGLAKAPATDPNLYEQAQISRLLERELLVDISSGKAVSDFIKAAQPQIVLHLAAQAIVVQSFQDPFETYQSNVMGTLNVLQACRDLPGLQALVVVTSDKCYLNEGIKPLSEADALGGSDPYSSSKACQEILSRSMAESFLMPAGVRVNSVRAGNIVGGGDWSAHRILPDIVRSLFSEKPLVIRMPQAIRPWQHVLDALFGYLLVTERLIQSNQDMGFESWNFGPQDEAEIKVSEILQLAQVLFPQLNWKIEPMAGVAESKSLALDSKKARQLLQWQPRFGVRDSVTRSLEWYAAYYQKKGSAHDLCVQEIDQVMAN